MSTIRDSAYITDAGRTMMTAGGDVTYTKAVLYGQDISHLTSDQVKALTTIGSPLREVKVGISDKQNTDRGTTVILEATFQNDNLANDLPYTAVGFFAQKGNDEKLIAVAVANTGAYLTATSPDGVATDALDLKLAIAIGDATSVTATVDPAGSVTPATLNGAISETKQVLTALIDTKASQSNLDQTNAEVAKKADSEAVNSQLATKANTTDIDKQVKTLNDAINTKADKATVDAEISKIDFTPYAKTADVNKEIKTVTDLANTKVDATYSYSKAELDKKLLALSTDTSGKVNASQVASMIAGKADKTDVDQKIATVNKSVSDLSDTVSANKTATDASLATKANASDVADNVKTLQANIDTKADKATVDAEIAKIDFTPYAKSADVAKDLQGYTTTADLTKLLAGKRDIADSYSRDELDKKFLQLSTDTSGKVGADQIAKLLASKADKTTVNSQVADAKNMATQANQKADRAQSTADAKANSSDVYTKADTDNKLGKKISFEICDSPQAAHDASTKLASDGSIVFGIYDMNNEPSEAYVAGQKINIEWLYNHFNDLQSTVNSELATKANQSDLDTTNATVESQSKEIESLKVQLNDAVNQINYIKANYIEGRRFAKSDEAKADAWEKENPQHVAFITDD